VRGRAGSPLRLRLASALLLGLPLAALPAGAAQAEPKPRGKAGAAAPAAEGRATRAAVEEKLRAYELPPSAGELAALGRGVDEVLVEVARDPAVEVLVRARALSALAYVPTLVSRRFLDQVLADKGAAATAEDRLLVRKAALALGWLGGSAAARRIGSLLGHADPDVRVDAALALGMTRQEVAADLLRAHIGGEKVDKVRTQMARQLKVIETALAAEAAPGGR
jgi:hypothetical protein